MISHPDTTELLADSADDPLGVAVDRTRALEVLHLDESSDSHAIETSYWTLVKHAQVRSPDEATAAREIEELNAAYGALAPTPTPMVAAKPQPGPARTYASRTRSTAAVARTPSSMDAVLEGLADEAARVRERWVGRAPELALLVGALAVLTVFALASGANIFVVVACVVAAGVGVWCPWRATTDDGNDEQH